MRIIVQCPHCGSRWWLASDAADRRVRCDKCGRVIKVPDLSEVPDAARVIERAVGEIYVDDTGRTYG